MTVLVSCWRKEDEVKAQQVLPAKRATLEKDNLHTDVYLCPHNNKMSSLDLVT